MKTLDRRNLIKAGLIAAVALAVPQVQAAEPIKLSTQLFPFRTLDTALKVCISDKTLKTDRFAVSITFYSETDYNWYTKSRCSTHKSLLVTFSQGRMKGQFAYTYKGSTSEAVTSVTKFLTEKLEVTDEIKGFVETTVTSFLTIKDSDLDLSERDLKSIKKYFEPEAYSIASRKVVQKVLDPGKLIYMNIGVDGITPVFQGGTFRTVGSKFVKTYVINVPSEIQGRFAQITGVKCDGEWEITTTTTAQLMGLPEQRTTVYTPVFEGVEDRQDKLISGQYGYKEYIFVQRAEKYLRSLKD